VSDGVAAGIGFGRALAARHGAGIPLWRFGHRRYLAALPIPAPNVPKVRSWIWRLVYLKLILLILWPNPTPMQLLPSPAVRLERAHAPAAPAAPARVSALEQQMPTVSRIPTLLTGRRSVQESERHTTRLPSIALCVVWLVGILLAAITTLRVTLVTRKTVRESRPLADQWLRRECEVLSHYLRLTRSPQLRSRENVSSPQTVGLLRPVILFPASFVDQFPTQEVRLVLAHELAHLQRHDLLWGWARRFVNAVLFFHPLVWMAHEQATLAEEIACDETALRAANATVSDYAGTLLKVTERSLLMSRVAATVLLGTGMSRAYRMVASRLQALQQIRSLCSGIARGRRRRATVLGCLAAAMLLPLGLMTWFHKSGIRQIDLRYPVLAFKVSRGRNHTMSVKREVCRFAGFKLSRVTEDDDKAPSIATGNSGVRSSADWTTNPNTTTGAGAFSSDGRAFSSATWTAPANTPGASIPGRVAGWLRRLGLKPQLDTGAYTSGVYTGEESCALIVRFAHDPRYNGYEDIAALLTDEHGETIKLAPYRSEFPPQSGEYVKFWVVNPAPVTRAKFTLRLRLDAEDKDVAVLRLGEL